MRIHAQDPCYMPGYADDCREYLTRGVQPHAPFPTGLVRSSHWRVYAGERELLVYDTPVTRGGPQSFVILPADADKVRAVYHCGVEQAELLPERAAVRPVITQEGICFACGNAGNLLLEVNGSIGRPLALFRADTAPAPDPEDDAVLWFEPGLHQLRTLELTDGQTVYLEEGAILTALPPDEAELPLIASDWAGKPVYKDLLCARGRRNIRVCGSGIIDTTALDWHARRTLAFESCEDVEVSGIVLVGACSWTMPFFGCKNIHVDGVRMLGYRENSDGIDLVDCHNALVENCFIRTGDDAICLKSMGGTPRVETHDIVVRHCSVWNDKVRAFGVAGETRHNVYHAVFEHCDVLHSFADWTTEVCALAVYICDGAEVSDITFRDIVIRQEVNHAVCCCIVKDKWSTDADAGQIHNILFDKIRFPENFSIYLAGYDSAHVLEDVRFEDCRAGAEGRSCSVLKRAECMAHTRNIAELSYQIPSSAIRIRDPFIVPVRGEQRYYMFGTTDADPWNGRGEGFQVYVSRDLELWSGPYAAFTLPEGFWATTQFWAPEVHFYRDSWYMFASFKAEGRCRGVQILRADRVAGPYVPLTEGPVTPAGWECLDGTLFLDQAGAPWIVFSHEWTQIENGAICCARLSSDLRTMEGEPVTLFHAKDALWSISHTGEMATGDGACYVTDGPWLYRSESGALRMIWSSFSQGGYAIGIAESASGQITGPWEQQKEPLLDFGGHGMIFDDFDGNTYLCLHAPNTDRMERMKLVPFKR